MEEPTNREEPEPAAGFFAEGGALSGSHPRYDHRPQQEAMAAAVAEAIEEKATLLVEAGTGVGKSLAYLHPFVAAGRENGKVAVSTGTKTLQTQLIENDIPFLARVLNIPIRAELCLGAANYLCLYRMNRASERGTFSSRAAAKQFPRIEEWSLETPTGVRLDLDFLPRPDVWSAVSVEHDFCLRQICPCFEECFYFRARARREKADILVMNHHLFFANLGAGGGILPQFKAVVFDEAHQIEEIATEFMGYEVSNYRLPNLLGYLYSHRSSKGFLPSRIEDEDCLEKWRELIEKLSDLNREFFASLEEKWPDAFRTVRLKEPGFAEDILSGPLAELEERLEEMEATITDEEGQTELKTYLSRTRKIREELSAIVNMEDREYVYWYSRSNPGPRIRQTLQMAPIEVGEYLNKSLWEKFGPIVLTSATLSVGGEFGYLKKRLGIDECRELILTSPFDYAGRVMIYADGGIPDPGREREEYEERVIQDTGRLIILSGGGVFALFTSYRMLDKAYRRLSGPLAEYGCLKQGEMERYQLLEEFRSRPGSVLFGTTSFWQGVDVPGEALKCVIITKLPFAVPDDPVTEARIDFIRESGGDPFREYQVPRAAIMLRQGFGRLMRHREDYGIVAILDPRLRTRSYGKTFLASLPPCPVTAEMADLDRFLKRIRGRENGEGEECGPQAR
ncbi:MAG: ATP-dependent DNA helicase [Candidatus Erginobacter occultus]|nr:ATP-dependent DNA helicase [Candidatus Erginobacter occultus]